nr:unnamed protein product [Digitaria exilis]
MATADPARLRRHIRGGVLPSAPAPPDDAEVRLRRPLPDRPGWRRLEAGDASAEQLRAFMAWYGELEGGPFGFDADTEARIETVSSRSLARTKRPSGGIRRGEPNPSTQLRHPSQSPSHRILCTTQPHRPTDPLRSTPATSPFSVLTYGPRARTGSRPGVHSRPATRPCSPPFIALSRAHHPPLLSPTPSPAPTASASDVRAHLSSSPPPPPPLAGRQGAEGPVRPLHPPLAPASTSAAARRRSEPGDTRADRFLRPPHPRVSAARASLVTATGGGPRDLDLHGPGAPGLAPPVGSARFATGKLEECLAGGARSRGGGAMASMLTGDRRWAAPARKSGMTVLGKVPKPINLPSQRSENHGLDPNLEIVPKGTLTWGSKAPSATPNAWEPASSKEFKKQQKSTDNSSTAVTTGVARASDQVQRLPNVPSEGTVVGPAHSPLTEVGQAGRLSDSINDRVHRRGDSRNSHHGPSKDRPANRFANHGRGESSTNDSLPVADIRNNIQHGQPPESASQLQPVIVPDDMLDSVDYESQRAKMKELAAERAKKLKAEEEERIKNQKAKALAKLEELNRRSSVLQKSNDTKVETDDKQKAELDMTATVAKSTAEPRNVAASDNLTVLPPPNEPKKIVDHVHPRTTPPSLASGSGKDPAAHAALSSVRNTKSSMDYVGQKSISQSHDISVPKPKQGYRKRHVASEEKITCEKPIVSVSTGNAKNSSEVSADTATAVVSPHDDPPAHNKKGARHLRNKKKVDDAPASSKHPPVVFSEQNTVKPSEPRTHTGGVIISSSIVPTEGTIVTVGSITVGGISLAPLNQDRVKSPEGTHNTENSRPRPQQAKRSGKHQHAVRPVEKPHGNEGVQWAPVKPPVQNEQSDRAMRNAAVADPYAGKSSNDVENVTRTKRAEMERYVPKPLSKELQQQNPCHDKEAIDKSSAAKLDAAGEPKKWEDKKTNKGHGKSNPSWRRRNIDESSLVVPNSIEQADNCHESKQVHKSAIQNQPVEPGKHEDKPSKSKADAAAENSSARSQTVPLSVNAAKEHSAANRQRRQHVKAQRNEANSYSNESKDREGRSDFVNQSVTPAVDSNSSDHRSMPRSDVKSSGAVSHSRTHWKPKSNSHPQNSPDGNIAVEGQVDTHGGTLEMNSSKGSDSTTFQDSSSNKPMKRSDDIDEKIAHSGQESLAREDDGNQKVETEHETVNPPPRRQGQHNARYHRGGGAHRGRGGYDAGRPSHGTNAERWRGGSHLEYQPVGSHTKATDFQQNQSVEERAEVPPTSGPAFRERGHNRGPRPAGHFVRRNPAPVPAANAYQDE